MIIRLFDNGAGGGSSDVTADGGGGSSNAAAASNEPSGTLTEGNDDTDLSSDGNSGDDDVVDVGEMFGVTTTTKSKVRDGNVSDSLGDDDDKATTDDDDDDVGLDVKDKDKKKSKKYPEITTTDDDDLSPDDKDKDKTTSTPPKDPSVGEDDAQVSNRRNYGEFRDTDVPYLKKLPNGIFNHVAPLFKKIYEQESKVKAYEDAKAGIIPESWYDSEDAYTLSPEYRKVVQGYQSAAFEISHWEQQLMKIEAGQPWQNISLDEKGQYRLSEPLEATPQIKMMMQKQLNKVLRQQDKYQAKAEEIQERHKTKHAEVNSYYDKASQQHFEQLLSELKPKDEHVKIFMDNVHPAHKDTGIAKLAAKMFSVIVNQGQMIKGLQTKQTSTNRVAADVRRAGPSAKLVASSAASAAKNNNKIIDLDELEQEYGH